ncbi:MAG: PKD domain-containing protein, partial [Solirubrobacteraceae bacterium]|nr:PKD domain-containing protein [Solirubrobacteraceae bacterium]
KTLRFDVGTKCGAGYVDILSVRLPRTAAQYQQLDANDRMAALETDITPSVSGMAGKVNYLVYADHAYGNDGVAGIGGVYLDDRPTSNNYANGGDMWAVAFGESGDPEFLNDRLTTVLHEVSHNLGAVQDSAPHSTQAGHCFDEEDVMCYDDGGASSTLTYPCATEAYDCGQDDYFNPAPAGGTYLATHWNIYNSTFLCPAGSCTGSDVGGGNPKPVARIGGATAATAGVAFTLDGSASTDEEGIAEYAWDIGADGSIESRDSRFTTTLASAGTYPVRLTVRDAYGAAGTADSAVTVVAPAPAVKQVPAPAPSRRAVAALALRSSLQGLRRALRASLTAARLKLPFSAPQAGRLEAKVSIGGRDVATGTRKVRSGRREQLTVSLSKAARRKLSRGGKVTVRLTFRPASGTAVVERQSVTLPRRA